MNIFIYLIWFLNMTVFILISFYSYKIIKFNIQNSNKNPKGIIKECNFSLNNPQLINITKNKDRCCLNGDKLITIDNITYQIGNVSNYYISSCKGLCKEGIDKNAKCINNEGQEDFDKCIALTEPTDCKGNSKPVAKIGTEFYYIINSGNDINCILGNCN